MTNAKTPDEILLGGKYKKIATLGSGGMGVVHHGIDTLLGREVAIKQLRTDFSDGTQGNERFLNEARIQARLTHHHLAQVYDFGVEGDSCYMVLQFVDGARLADMLPLPWRFAVPLFLQVLDGLAAAHLQDTLHRDLKPENIMVTARGHATLMDFGIAHVLGTVRHTQGKSVVGTPDYLSPERIQGADPGPRDDIYSLGIVLFQVLTGRPPFESPNDFKVYQSHLHDPLPALNVDCPAFLEAVLRQAAHKEAEERFADCHAMAAALRAGMGDEAQTAPPQVIDKCARKCEERIRNLLVARELDLAALVFRVCATDFTERPEFQELWRALGGDPLAANAARDEDVNRILARLAELEGKHQRSEARELVRQAIGRYPQVPGLRLAAAYLGATDGPSST